VILIDHAAEYFPPPDRCIQRGDDRLGRVGWSLSPGLVRPMAVVMVGVRVEY
jgi:hypothetical protein